ncbi:hypothetical protein AJ78_06303 [Emergomyces pasteurianus Ep9510]|uniref:Pectate lyase n=1 Tax=Emergomyces pasteurianus Ep9510 TaxID=1447872 RepID=A0A1J9PZ90_9EURO|nr:hypothetical protein AJ78_06303 [Emergomyces pasteurianus Ep9510]
MHISFAVIVGLLATSISAIPTPQISNRDSRHVLVQITNDMTGASGTVELPLDGQKKPVADLFGNTNIASGGQILATSVQFTKIIQGGTCIFVDGVDTVFAHINDRQTFDDLDGDRSTARPVDLRGTFIKCGIV